MVGLLVCMVGGWVFLGGQGDGPRYKGHTAEEWWAQLLRASPRRYDDGSETAYLEARVALLSLGTPAVKPAVLTALSDLGDRPVQRLLRPFLRFAGAQVTEPGQSAREARELLADLAPDAALVLPMVEASLRRGGEESAVGLGLLLGCRDDGRVGAEWERRRQAGGDRWLVDQCAEAQFYLRPAPDSVVPLAVARLKGENQAGFLWNVLLALASMKERAAAAVPALEQVADLTGAVPDLGNPSRVLAVVTLLEIEPGHVAAAAWLRSRTYFPAFSAWNHVTNQWAGQLLAAATEVGKVRCPVTLEILESLARDEVEAWETRGLASQASGVLERLAPERTAPLYRGQMSEGHKDNVRLVAAAGVLRTDPLDPEAVRVLAAKVQDDHALARMALVGLQDAGPGNLEAQRVLEATVDRSNRLRNKARVALLYHQQSRLRDARRAALASERH
ncbi:MAG: hypothetical protein IT577_24380 [Verrucomicrobiae bacterium]|nr:hypothetical protein [Verrucomicrobiae bacterium]